MITSIVIKKLRFIPIFELAKLESWFHKQAKSGLILTKIDHSFCYFRKQDSKNLEYHITINPDKEPHPDWEYVCHYKKIHIYCTTKDQSHSSFLETDHEITTYTDWMKSKRKKYNKGFFPICLLLGINLFTILDTSNGWSNLLFHNNITFITVIILLFWILTSLSIRNRLNQLTRFRKDGTRKDKRTFYPTLICIAILISSLLYLNCLCLFTCNLLHPEKKLDKNSRTGFVRLIDINHDCVEQLTYTKPSVFHDNTYDKQERTLFTSYAISEFASLKDQSEELYIEAYRLRFPWFSSQLFEAFQKDVFYPYLKSYKKISLTDAKHKIKGILYYTKKHDYEAIVSNGKIMASINYTGHQNLHHVKAAIIKSLIVAN